MRVPPHGTRPTSDRAREALFSSLGHHLGGFAGLRVLDAFAGSGALGLEALSRGAEHVDLVDSSAGAVEAIRLNARTVGMPGASVHRRTIDEYLAALASEDPRYDLVLLDPPYAMSATAVERLLEDLGDHLRDGALVVLERGKRSEPVTWPSGYEIVAEKAYSQTRITIALW